MQVPDNDFMAGFESDDDTTTAGAGAAGAGGADAGAGASGAGAGAGGGGDAGNGQGAAGAAQGGAAAGSAGAADQGAAGAASGGDAFAAGLAGEAQPGGQTSAAQGVDTAQNGEQGRGESQALDLSALPESVRQKLEEAERLKQQVEQLDGALAASRRDHQAAVGRVAPLQQQLAALQQGAQSAQQQATTQAGAGDAGAGETLADADKAIADAEAYFESPEFKRYAEQWPDEAKVQRDSQMGTLKAVRSMRAQLEKQVGEVSRTVQQDVVPHLQQVRHNEAVAERKRELSDLATAHPDWREINVSPEFTAWFEKHKPLLNFKDADHMRERLNDGEYVSSLLSSYKEAKGVGTGGQQLTAEQLQQQQEQQQRQQQDAQQQQQTSGASARLALAGGPDRTGTTVVKRPDATGVTPGDDFMAGFGSTS